MCSEKLPLPHQMPTLDALPSSPAILTLTCTAIDKITDIFLAVEEETVSKIEASAQSDQAR